MSHASRYGSNYPHAGNQTCTSGNECVWTLDKSLLTMADTVVFYETDYRWQMMPDFKVSNFKFNYNKN